MLLLDNGDRKVPSQFNDNDELEITPPHRARRRLDL